MKNLKPQLGKQIKMTEQTLILNALWLNSLDDNLTRFLNSKNSFHMVCSELTRMLLKFFVPKILRTLLILSGSAWFFVLNKSQRGICSRRLNLLLQKMPKHWVLNFQMTFCRQTLYYWRLMLFITNLTWNSFTSQNSKTHALFRQCCYVTFWFII